MSIYYVKVNGSDNQSGLSDASAWATWQKGFDTADAGDIVYFKGGTWYPTTKASGTGITIIDPSMYGTPRGHNGTIENPVCFYADPSDYAIGNFPVLDCSFITDASYGNIGLVIQNATHIKFKGLTICNSKMYNLTANSGGISAADVGVLHFENVVTHGNGGAGLWVRTYNEAYLTNCDSYNNNDYLDEVSPGGDGDGFALSARGLATDLFKKTYVIGCRSWNNADDGFDIGTTKQVYIYNCWAFNNGRYEGDGTGFKLSYSSERELYKRVMYNCITAYNKKADGSQTGAGYSQLNLYDQILGPWLSMYNNLSYKDDQGITSADSWSPYNISYYRNVLYNNIVLSPESGTLAAFKSADYTDGVPSYVSLYNNTFVKTGIYGNTIPNPLISVSDNDFILLPTDASNCMAILSAARKPDGSLPDVSIFHLAAGSDLIGAGMNLGLTFDTEGTPWKNPPSLGPFEYDGDSSTLTLNVSTGLITDISSYTAKCGGNVTHDGSIALTYKGICWRSTIENPTVFDASIQNASTGEGTYDSSLSNLNANTLYHVKAFAYNSAGIAYGQDVSFYTLPGLPTAISLFVINISTNCASLYSYIENDGSSSIIDRGACWNTSPTPTVSNSHSHDSSGTGGFVSNLTSLSPNTVYFTRTYATNAYGTAYGLDISFNTLTGNTYYVATDGSDSYPGTISQPWATWQKGFNEASAGDTVYFRGGIWYPTTKTYGYSITCIDPCHGYGRNGTVENPICYYNYPGEIPILDCSLASNSSGNNGIGLSEVTNIKFKGLTIRNVKEVSLGPTIAGIYANECGNISFENMDVYNIQGEGIWIRGYDKLDLINCDSHHNFDPLGDLVHVIGGMGDGFLISSRATSYTDAKDKIANIYGCRAWYCSDDGFDLNVQQLYMDRCWSFVNGASTGGPGGCGIKTNTGSIRDSGQKVFRNCITAYSNASTGGGGGIYFTNFENTLGTILSYHNNFSYCDDRITASVTAWDFNINNFNNQFVNNIAYRPVASYIGSFDAAGANYQTNQYAHLTTNTFRIQSGTTTGKCETNPLYTLTNADFLSLDVSELSRPRKADGSLPDVSFGHLAPGSDLIGKGTNLGLSFDSDGTSWKNPPSLGAFEYDYDSSNLSITVTTTEITDISSYIATSGGNVTHDGSISLTYRGVCWRTSENPTIIDGSTRDISTGEGTYDSSITGLYANTLYHVKAYAYNSDGIAYGQDVSFYTSPGLPTIVTIGITDIGTIETNSASCYTHLMNDGSSAIIARGVCWNTSSNPTLSNSHSHDSSELGLVIGNIIGLNSSTYYFIRAYATNAYGTAYGLDVSFNTLDTSTHSVPTVTTSVISDISTYTATGSGNVTHDGSISLTYRGICISTNASPTTIDVSFNDASTGEGSYSLNLTGLNANTQYYVRAFAYNWSGTSYGIDVSFNTLAATSSFAQIIADHTIIDRWDDIPAAYMIEAKKMLISYAGESHSEAVRNGLILLNASYSDYDVSVSFSPPEASTDVHMRATGNTWGDLTHATGWYNSYGEEDWFTSEAAIAQTKVGLTYYNTSGPLYNVFGFGWCWDPAIDTSAEYSTYLDATQQYINYCTSLAYPTKVIFTTGPVDNMNATGELGYNKSLGHQQIRDYVANDSTTILYDFADILCYDDNGNASTNTWNGHTYPIIATSNLGDATWAHMAPAAGIRLAKGIWWMMARIAGWDGSTLDSSNYSVPTVTTSAISDISTYTATGGGNVTSDGSISLTYRGICWSTSASPTTLDTSSLNASTGEGSYVSYLSALSASTHYHVRAFAYNSQGTSYGIDVSFNTLAATPVPPVDTSIKTVRAFGKLIRYRGKIVKL